MKLISHNKGKGSFCGALVQETRCDKKGRHIETVEYEMIIPDKLAYYLWDMMDYTRYNSYEYKVQDKFLKKNFYLNLHSPELIPETIVKM